MEVFLNPDVYREFRNAFNETPLFMYNEEYKTCFNLFCAVTDRLESCIEYLNGHAETPKTEEDFLIGDELPKVLSYFQQMRKEHKYELDPTCADLFTIALLIGARPGEIFAL